MTLRSLLPAVLLLLLATPSAHAVRELTGQTPGGAYYRIMAPDNWRAGDALVLYQHGFSFSPPDNSPGLGPLRDLQLSQGYAVAASSFSQRGWALFRALDDNAELLAAFTAAFGEPGEIVAFGGSMGGLISLKLAEDPRFSEKTSGVFALCPPAGGARTWESAFDLRLTYDAVCRGVGGGELPKGAEPYPWAINLADIPPDLDDLEDDPAVLRSLVRVTQCTGLALPPGLRTQPQRERLERLKRLSGISSEEFLAVNLGYAVFALSDLLRAPDKLNGRNPFQNAGDSVRYGDIDLDREIARVTNTSPFAALDFDRASSLQGVGRAKILSLHTSGDELVVPEHQSALRRLYPAERLSSVLVNESVRTHCTFTEAEGLAGWDQLRHWIAGTAPKPTASGLNGLCNEIVAFGGEGPCRIESGSTLAPLESRIAQRTFAPRDPISGSWIDPARIGEGWTLEVDPGKRCSHADLCDTAVSWFTYPPQDAPGAQRWIVGAGSALGRSLSVTPAVAGVSGFFPDRDARVVNWGAVDFEFGTDGTGWVRYGGPVSYAPEVRAISQLSVQGRPGCSFDCLATISPLPSMQRWLRSGTYYDAARPGSGLILQLQLDANRPSDPVRAFAIWYTFDNAGQPLWLVGEGAYADPQNLVFDVVSTRGTRFGPGFDPTRVERVPWGRVTVHFPPASSPALPGACDADMLTWNATQPGYGSGSIALTRLTGQNQQMREAQGCSP